ncbi:hypothetical protein ACOCJ5_02815 [Knoellia sp. CPCC 206450]|uniref:hypothetical protein n=1 Tax=Knoellia tibetensis TaxID=3404798 RepID=UPI003B42A5BC
MTVLLHVDVLGVDGLLFGFAGLVRRAAVGLGPGVDGVGAVGVAVGRGEAGTDVDGLGVALAVGEAEGVADGVVRDAAVPVSPTAGPRVPSIMTAATAAVPTAATASTR